DFDRAIGLDETMAWAIANRGVTYRQMGQYAQALADFDRAIGLDETNASMIAGRGETYRQMGQYAQALADFDRAIELDSSDWYLYGRALTCRALGQEEAAASDLAQAIEGARAAETASPDDWRNRLNLAVYYLASGDLAAAEDRSQAARDAGVNEGRARDAIQDLNDYLRLFPADEAAREMRQRWQRYVEERFPKGDRREP
ncbi:MAG: tetratricopeptide repeat protein, partial [Anaerolineae bacterium]